MPPILLRMLAAYKYRYKLIVISFALQSWNALVLSATFLLTRNMTRRGMLMFTDIDAFPVTKSSLPSFSCKHTRSRLKPNFETTKMFTPSPIPLPRTTLCKAMARLMAVLEASPWRFPYSTAWSEIQNSSSANVLYQRWPRPSRATGLTSKNWLLSASSPITCLDTFQGHPIRFKGFALRR